MLRKRRLQLGNRVLHLGACGPDVLELQRRLESMGYDPGPLDGQFGYLTEDALRQFQRDYHCRVDGIAGREVHAILAAPDLTKRRLVHVVGQDESLRHIAAKYQMREGAVLSENRLYGRPTIYPGQRLSIPRRVLFGWMSAHGDSHAIRVVGRQHHLLSGVLMDGFQLDRQARVEGPVPAAIQTSPVILTIRQDADTCRLLGKREKLRSNMRASIAQWASDASAYGVGIALPPHRRGDGTPFRRLVQAVNTAVKKTDKAAVVIVPAWAPRSRLRQWWDEIDYQALAAQADYVILCAHLPRHDAKGRVLPEPAAPLPWLREIVKAAIHSMPSWKILLSLPVCGYEFVDGQPPATISYQAAMTQAFSLRQRVRWDSDLKALGYEYQAAGVVKKVWFENKDSFAAKLELVGRYNLGGVAVWRLGYEDTRIWDTISQHFCVWKPEAEMQKFS